MYRKKFIVEMHTYLTLPVVVLAATSRAAGEWLRMRCSPTFPPEQDTKSWPLLNEGDPLSVFSLNFAGYLTVTTKAKPKQF